jgi:hypothetical protein
MSAGAMISSLEVKEATLKHAFTIVDTLELDGRITTTYYHYLTCEKCRLRKLLGLPVPTDKEIYDGRKFVQRDRAQ